MRLIPWAKLGRPGWEVPVPVRLTIGVFDGVHLGHRRLIRGILDDAAGRLPLVVTFEQNPQQLLAPGSFPGSITTYAQKLERLEALGVQAVVAIDFSNELSKLSGKAFLGALRENLTIEKIVVGYNFRYGKGRSAGTDDLRETFAGTGTDVVVAEPVLWGDSAVSSSRIRKTVQEAELAAAREMLAAPFSVDLRGLSLETLGSGCFLVQRRILSQILPPIGTYRVSCEGEAGTGRVTVTVDDLVLEGTLAWDTRPIAFD
ncbi:MAG TPA: FAD synthetase family protein [Spirochaetia bacterium]|nr:FAD synthetase family protein [Spirochaetia bacterium]